MDNVISETRKIMEKVVYVVAEDMGTIRVGVAKPSMVQDISISAYGQRMTIKELANVTAPDPNQVIITPWDKGVLKDLEKGIIDSDLGLMPNVSGDMIRIVIPPLTEERRRDYVKLVGQKLESGKVMMRQVRQEGRDSIDRMKDADGVSEDDIYRLFKELDDLTNEFIDKLENMAVEKEAEIMKI